MRIRRIELRGFKSFVDKTVFQLGPGVSGVVGPNGCGKSNVIDAIRWTLGEQNASLLRGKAMEDVIFSGSEGRKPSSLAEVHIAFDNADGSFGGAWGRFAEIEVGRRLYRDGTSSYLINRAECRRKDIVALFLDTGVGARAYSIIEQGRVGFIVNAKPEERRVLIDEVAGINRFKSQRIEAERRMERTKNNLVRVGDMITEMARQRRSLQIQAGRATRYREMRNRWKAADLRALLGASRVDRAGFVRARDALTGLSSEEKRLLEELDAAQAKSVALREKAEQARRGYEQLRERSSDVDSKRQLALREGQFRAEERRGVTERLERLGADVLDMESNLRTLSKESEEATARSAEARAKLMGASGRMASASGAEDSKRSLARAARQQVEQSKARIVELMAEVARKKNQSSYIERQRDEIDAHLERLEVQVSDGASETKDAERAVELSLRALEAGTAARAEADAALVQIQSGLAEARSTAASARQEFERIDGERRRVEARHDSLEQLLWGMEGYSDGVRALVDKLKASPETGFLGTIADLLDLPAELEATVELALGDRLQGVVVSDLPASLAGLDGVAGGRLFLVEASDEGAAASGSLAQSVGGSDQAPGLANQLLGSSFADEAGVRSGGGVWLRGKDERASGLLGQKRVVRELAEQREVLEAEASAHRSAREAAEQRFAEGSSQRDEAKGAAHAAELKELTCKRDVDEANSGRARIAAGAEHAQQERVRLEARRKTFGEELAGVTSAIEGREKEHESLGHQQESLRQAAAAAEREAEGATAAATALRVELAAAEQGAAGHQREARRLESQLGDVDRRVKRSEQERRGLGARDVQLKELVGKLQAEAELLESEQKRLGDAVAAAAGATDRASSEWRRSEDGMAEHRQKVEVLRRKIGAEEVALAEARTGLQAHRVRAASAFDLDLDPLLETLATEGVVTVQFKGEDAGSVTVEEQEVCDAVRVEAQRQEALNLAAKIERLGPVNLAAEEEFTEVDARHAEMLGQKEDLEEALGNLRKAIHKIEVETRDRFGAAFAAVSERFSQIYPQLVGGGRAELSLTEPDDLLGTGIDIMVQPPGKSAKNLTLLSGGEKAMAAIALVFGIFQVKPSPFCLLDEVDAPLDDANSRRFNVMLRAMSAETQFIVITHNRTTMEVADILYGVTMQVPGVSSVVSVQLDQVPQAS
jgi:chromosome segregation protein